MLLVKNEVVMSNMGAIGIVEVSKFLAGIGVLGTAVGTAISIGGPSLFNKLSLHAKKKQEQQAPNSWQERAWKVTKIASVVLSALTGLSGSVAAGGGVFFAVSGFSMGTLAPLGLGLGIATTVALQAYAIHKLITHIELLAHK